MVGHPHFAFSLAAMGSTDGNTRCSAPVAAVAEPPGADAVLAAARWLREADVVLVCAGAGMSVNPGAGEAVYVSEKDFAYHYPYMLKHGYSTAYETMGLERDPKVPDAQKWGFYSDHYYDLRWRYGACAGYKVLRSLIGDRDYFVLTSNVDGAFERTGWDRDRIYTPQGDAAYYQCMGPCAHDSVWEARPLLDRLAAERDPATGCVPESSVPRCPRCGGLVWMNLRGGAWFLHHKYDETNRNFTSWVDGVLSSGRRLAVVEIGAGFNTPVVTRFPVEAIVREASHQGAHASLIRINPEHCQVPGDLPRAIGLQAGWEALLAIAKVASDAGEGSPGRAALEEAERRITSARASQRGGPVRNTTDGRDFDWRRMMRSLSQH